MDGAVIEASNKREAQTILISRFISQISGAGLNFHGSGAVLVNQILVYQFLA